MSADRKKQLIGNLVSAMQGVPKEIQERQIGRFYKADPACGEDVAKGPGLAVSKADKARQFRGMSFGHASVGNGDHCARQKADSIVGLTVSMNLRMLQGGGQWQRMYC